MCWVSWAVFTFSAVIISALLKATASSSVTVTIILPKSVKLPPPTLAVTGTLLSPLRRVPANEFNRLFSLPTNLSADFNFFTISVSLRL